MYYITIIMDVWDIIIIKDLWYDCNNCKGCMIYSNCNGCMI